MKTTPFYEAAIDGEIWKDISGFDGEYKISNYGRVLRVGWISVYRKLNYQNLSLNRPYYKFAASNDMFMRQRMRSEHYLGVNLSKNHKYSTHNIHSLVGNAFVKKPKGATQINHKDGNKLNNHASNLEWVTPRENVHHSKLNVLFIGVRHKRTENRYASYIMIKGVDIYLGRFMSPEEAHLMYLFASEFYGIKNKYLPT